MSEITLSNIEQQFSTLAAIQRHNLARERGRTNMKVGPQSDFITDLNGIGGELAVAKYLNLYPDLDWSIKTQTGEPDLIDQKGTRIDVKTTHHQAGKLLVARLHKSKTNIDIYILVIADYPKFRLAGWAVPADIFQDQNLHDFGYGEAYALDQEKLGLFP